MDYLGRRMPKSKDTKKIEVHLMPEVFNALKKLADNDNRSVKNYAETLLINHIKEQKKK